MNPGPDAAQWYANNIAIGAVVVSLVAIVVSVLAVVYARRQTLAAERQAKTAEETLRLQAEALKSQGEDTRKALDLAKQSAENAQSTFLARRAWIAAVSEDLARDGTANLPRSAAKTFTNTGETQALNVTSWDSCCVLATVEPLILADEDYNDELVATHAIVGPQTSIVVRREFDLTDLVTNALVRDGDMTLWWYGRINYSDIFHAPHTLTWCYEYNVKEQRFDLSNLNNGST